VAPTEIPRVVVFAIAAFFVVWLSSAQRAATDSLRRARDDLQAALEELAGLNKTLQVENAERKRAEQQLRQTEQELRLTIDTIPVGVATYRRDGTPDFYNQSWRNYTGLSLEELKAHRNVEVHPDDRVLIDSEWRAHLATGMPFQREQRDRRADGEYRWHLIRRVPLRDENGEVIKWYGAGYDIEDQKRAEGALRRSEAYLAEAQRLSHTGSFGWGVPSGDIVWSKEMYRILEVDQAVKPTIDLVLQRVHPDDRELVQLELDRVVRGEQDCDNECRLLMPDGFVKHLHVRVRRVKYETGEEEIVGALMDITETRKAQEALHTAQSELAHVTRLTTLGEMSASIAHEVNQPLASVVTNGDACLRWLDHDVPQLDEARSAVERMISGASHASDVISRIRALSKKGAFERARLDVNEVINDVLVLMRREITDHRVSLRLDLGSSLPPAHGDRVQLQQVIMNLLMNGIQAMKPVTDRRRELLIRSREHGSDQLLVAVEDSGIGIEPENADRLFNAFFTTKPDGLGIGLSICRSIIEQHDGRIWATRNAGTGSTFQFTLPAFRETAS
jgi:PAS domain S-box-containing protein